MPSRKDPAVTTLSARWDGRRFLFVAGPGIVVMLADTDAGSLITAAQSGARWGYRLQALQFLLIPIRAAERLDTGVGAAKTQLVTAAALLIGALVVSARINLVALSVAVQVMNALLLPIVLGFLFLLARRLPEPYRLKGSYAVVVTGLTGVVVVFGVFSGLAGIWS